MNFIYMEGYIRSLTLTAGLSAIDTKLLNWLVITEAGFIPIIRVSSQDGGWLQATVPTCDSPQYLDSYLRLKKENPR